MPIQIIGNKDLHDGIKQLYELEVLENDETNGLFCDNCIKMTTHVKY